VSLGLTAGAKMKWYARSRWFSSKVSLSQVLHNIVFAVGCGALIFFAPPIFAQRGGVPVGGSMGGHPVSGARPSGGARGSSGGRAVRSVGGWAHAEPHNRVQVFSGARPHAEPARVSAPAGMVSYSGEPARGESPKTRSYRGDTGAPAGNTAAGARGFGAPQHFGGSMRAERGGQHELSAPTAVGPVEPRHVTIGFPPNSSAWRRAASQHRSGTLAFAGQGHAVWQTAPRQMPSRIVGGTQAASSHPAGEWQPPANDAAHRGDRGTRGGRHDRDHSGHKFRREYSHGYGFYSYPFYGYGLGVWPGCEAWLNSDWYGLQGYDENCANAQPQDKLIVSYGADQSDSAGQADTQREYGPYAWQNPPSAANSGASADTASQQSGSSAQRAAAPDTLIYLADGSNYAVTSYWLSGGDLHYVTSYGAEDSVPIRQINLQRTVDANAAQGVQFTLRPSPRSDSGTVH
jgi:hypothetical protein